MKVSDWQDEIEQEVLDEIDMMLDKLCTSNCVSLNYYRELRKEQGWQPLSLEDYALKVRGTQRQIVERGLEKSRKIINDRVKRQNKLTDKKKD